MNFFLLASSLWLSVIYSETSKTDLKTAIRNHSVYATYQGNEQSTHYLRPLKGELRNLTNKNLEIVVPAGYHFASQDPDVQDIITTQEELIALGPKETLRFTLSGMCIQHYNVSPGQKDAFKLVGEANPKLFRLAHFINDQKLQTCQGQQAMWAVADGGDIAPLFYDNLDNNRELIELTCELLGMPKLTDAEYKARMEEGLNSLQAKAEIRGRFSFKFSRKAPIHIALFTDEGIVLKEIYKEVASIGRHNVEYTFDALPYQGQTIHAKLIAYDDVLIDRAIEL